MSIEQYRRYRRALKSTPFSGRHMEYAWGGLPEKLNIGWMPYSEMFDEFSRELANAINQLTDYAHRLKAWSGLVVHMDDKQKMDIAHEFVDSIATVALNLPYVIRSRFIFASAHLCHQANHARERASWKDDLPLDSEIYFDTADRYGASWRRYKKFKLSVEKIGAKHYQTDTGDFRHAYNHRFSRRIVIGQTQIVTRQVDKQTGHVRYGFGGAPALTVEVIARLLAEQCQHCYRAFEAFQQLVREHEGCIALSQSEHVL